MTEHQMPKKIFKVQSEAEMEAALVKFIKIAKSKLKTKVLNLWFPTEGLSNIFLENAYKEAKVHGIKEDSGMNINVYIEKEDNEPQG